MFPLMFERLRFIFIHASSRTVRGPFGYSWLLGTIVSVQDPDSRVTPLAFREHLEAVNKQGCMDFVDSPLTR